MELPSKDSLEKAAQCWCDDETRKTIMDEKQLIMSVYMWWS